MKTPLLIAALTLSLAANAYLWLRSADRPNHGAAESAPIVPNRSPSVAKRAAQQERLDNAPVPGAAEVDSAQVISWRGDYSAAALRQLAAELERAGIPAHAARATIDAMISRHVRSKSDLARLPFWQRGSGGPKFKAAADKMNAEVRALTREVFGTEDGSPDLDPIARNDYYGDLPPAKIAGILKLDRDYYEVYRSQLKNPDGSNAAETAEGRLRLRLIEEERAKDVAALLTPAEFREWEKRNSRPARNVIQGAKNTDISAAEYDALVEVQRNYEAGITTTGAAETIAALRGWVAPVEQLRTVLSDDRLYAYLEGADPLYGLASRFAATNSLPREQTNALYQLQLEAVSAIAHAAGTAKTADFANTAAGRTVLAPFEARLTTLLGPERAAAYRKNVAGKLFVISR